MYLVFDVGGTFIKHALMNEEGEILYKGKVATPRAKENTVDDFVETIYGIYTLSKEKIKEFPNKCPNLKGIAMALPGQIDVDNGIVYNGGAITYLDKLPLGKLLSDKCDGLPVVLENDGKCAALAEVWKGNAAGKKSAVVVVIGTGVGGGIVIDGKILHGVDMIAGEMSYIYENVSRADIEKIRNIEEAISKQNFVDFPKCLLTMKCSTMALCRRVSEMKNIPYPDVSGELIYKWAKEGDEISIEALEDMYFSIAKHLCNMYVICAPEKILVGGGISAEPAFIEGIKKYVSYLTEISTVYSKMDVGVCKFRNDSNLIGAQYNFMQRFE